MRRNKRVRSDSETVHERITVIVRTLCRVRSSTGSYHSPIKAIILGTARCDSSVGSISRFFHAIEEWPESGNVFAVGSIVVLYGTSLIHVSNTLINTMLASERPGSISILRLLCISIGKRTEINNRSNSV